MDEPALREGLPLKASRHAAYLDWAVGAFRLATAAAPPEVQVGSAAAGAQCPLAELLKGSSATERQLRLLAIAPGKP